MNAKQLAAAKAVDYVRSGMIVGLGTGSTAYWAIEMIGEKISQGHLQIKAIATSRRSEEQALKLGIPIISFAEIESIDLTIDGADEADRQLNLIKGGGGALLREKIVASNTREEIIIVDAGKMVEHVGRFPLPVEVIAFGWEKVFQKLQSLGSVARLRQVEDGPYITDNGNYIIDCAFGEIRDPATLHDNINSIVGVVENGLFIGLASRVVIASENGEINVIERS